MMKNTPYRKEYNKDGEVTNPIIGIYKSPFENRKKRREYLNIIRFKGNGKSFPLTIHKTTKYLRVLQRIFDKKTGNIKLIEHYLTH